jgi:hypothetical protein
MRLKIRIYKTHDLGLWYIYQKMGPWGFTKIARQALKSMLFGDTEHTGDICIPVPNNEDFTKLGNRDDNIISVNLTISEKKDPDICNYINNIAAGRQTPFIKMIIMSYAAPQLASVYAGKEVKTVCIRAKQKDAISADDKEEVKQKLRPETEPEPQIFEEAAPQKEYIDIEEKLRNYASSKLNDGPRQNTVPKKSDEEIARGTDPITKIVEQQEKSNIIPDTEIHDNEPDLCNKDSDDLASFFSSIGIS